MTTQKTRTVARVVKGVRTLEGGGFMVRRPFPTQAISEFDPFLLLDEMGPADHKPGEAVGAPDHPHRGFETVTYVLEGRMQHADSAGHRGTIGPGDVQWMTAGAGVVHAEMPAEELMKNGGRMHGFQLWVNLPRRDKLMRPLYQEVKAAEIPSRTSEDGKVKVRVIAGEALGAKAVIDTRVPISYLHFTIAPGGRHVQPLAKELNAFAYVFGGKGRFGGKDGVDGDSMLFANDGDEVTLENTGTEPLEVLLLAGTPLEEPVVRYGPFVMNTRQEIYEAIADFQSGRMGRIEADLS